MTDDNNQDAIDDNAFAQEPRLWQNETWTAKVIKNDDDDGWAVAMFKDGESEAALIGPWTMGRVKTASEFVRRSEQQLHATLHQSVTVNGRDGRVTVLLDIVPDDDNPYAILSAQDEGGDTLAEVRVDAGYKLNRNTAQAWVDAGFAKPKGARD
jgi:hypothetical protein